MALIAWGLIGGLAAVAVAGVVAGAVGLGVAWYGGILYDAHARTSVTDELENLEEGRTYQGVSPEDEVQARAPRRQAEEAARQHRELDTSPRETRRRTAVSAAPTLLLGLAVWTFVSQFLLALPFQETAVDTRIRVSGVAIALALAALVLRQVGPSKIALGVCALCGTALVVSSFLAPHAVARTRWTELVTGVLVLLVTAVASGLLRYPESRGDASRGGASS